MLANDLVTNEIKNRAGTEVEFTRISTGPGAETVFAQKGESPSSKHRLSIKHAEFGTGVDARRRSLIRFDKTVGGEVDSLRASTNSVYIVADVNIGNLNTMIVVQDLIAELLSFCATTGAATTVLFDGTGNGAQALINGTT